MGRLQLQTFSHRAHSPARTVPGVAVKDKPLCDALAIDEGHRGLYLAWATSVNQSLSVNDVMKKAIQPDGSCSQGQYSFKQLYSLIEITLREGCLLFIVLQFCG